MNDEGPVHQEHRTHWPVPKKSRQVNHVPGGSLGWNKFTWLPVP